MLMMHNLSQDVTDLFGTDLPVEGGKGGEFAWRDGPLLAALKAGHWVVLDEVGTDMFLFADSYTCNLTLLMSLSFLNLLPHVKS